MIAEHAHGELHVPGAVATHEAGECVEVATAYRGYESGVGLVHVRLTVGIGGGVT